MMKKVLKFCKILVLIIILFGIFSGCFLVLDYFYRIKKASSKLPVDVQIEEEEKVEVPVKNKLSLIMVGDALIHGAVYEDARIDGGYDFKPMLENVKDYIKGYDLAFYNQESILGGSDGSVDLDGNADFGVSAAEGNEITKQKEVKKINSIKYLGFRC